MLQPKKTKYRKMQKGHMKGNSHRGSQIAFGSFAIKSLEECWMTARQIEAARIAVTRYMKREGQIWIRVFPDKPVTKKPAEVRMGKGKGSPELWVATVRPGKIIFEAPFGFLGLELSPPFPPLSLFPLSKPMFGDKSLFP